MEVGTASDVAGWRLSLPAYPPIALADLLYRANKARSRPKPGESGEREDTSLTGRRSFRQRGRREEIATLMLSRHSAEGSPSLDEGVMTGNWDTIFWPHPTSFLAGTVLSWTFITSFSRRCRLL